MMGQLTKEALVEVLRDADRFACDALSAFIHKSNMFDTGEGRFGQDLNFFSAVGQLQEKLRIVAKRLEGNQ